MPRHPCRICSKGVTWKTGGILCTSCNKWVHLNCINIAYSTVKNLSEEELRTWKCTDCSISTTEPVNSSSLAQELDCALLEENENLRQELHEAKNKSSLFELQLEDDLKQKEEELETIKKFQETKVLELEEKIKSLEMNLKRERDRNEVIIAQAQEEKLALQKQNTVPSVKVDCNECMILREETNNMLSSIRTLETVISVLKKENNELQQRMKNFKSNCITCFPPLIRTKQSKSKTCQNDVSNWQEVKRRNSRLPKNKILASTPACIVRNRFDIFSDYTSDEEEIIDEKEEEGLNNDTKSVKTKKTRLRKEIISQRRHEEGIRLEQRLNKPKMLLCTDSHGRELTFHLCNITNRFDAVGFVKPGGCAKQVLNKDNIEGEQLKEGDILVIMAGSNDVARNEARGALNEISDVIKKHQNKRIILVDLPIRHDLTNWSCVNFEIKKTNSALKELSEQYSNLTLVEASLAERNLHTRHGQHLNRTGKSWLANKIYKAVAETSLETERAPSSVPQESLPESIIHAAEETLSEETSQTVGVTSGNQQQLSPPATEETLLEETRPTSGATSQGDMMRVTTQQGNYQELTTPATLT